MSKEKVAINETFAMPSRGLLDEMIPESITLRAMTTMEEKMRLGSTGITVMPNIIKACLVDPIDSDTHRWTLPDIQFAMYKLRTVTYGPEYKLTLKCPKCGNEFEIIVNLDELPVNELPDGFVNPFAIDPLPVSGDELECRFLSIKDYVDIDKESKRILRKFPEYQGDPAMICMLQHKIVKVNGEVLQGKKLQDYCEKMHARDLRFFNSKYNKVADSFGMDIYDMAEACPRCGNDVEFDLPVTEEFFRPEY